MLILLKAVNLQFNLCTLFLCFYIDACLVSELPNDDRLPIVVGGLCNFSVRNFKILYIMMHLFQFLIDWH